MTIPRRMACDLRQVGSDHDAAAERPQAARERNALVAARRGTPWGQVLRCNILLLRRNVMLRCKT